MHHSILELRHKLHQYPELSGLETETALKIKEFVLQHANARIIEHIGGTGLAVVFTFKNAGPRIMIRCELDALPIHESNEISYKSSIDGVAHKCGHDGHMAIVAGLIFGIQKKQYSKGEIVLLFQPSEENGAGALRVLNDPKFSQIEPDYIFALHNVPGYPENAIICFEHAFSATVQSLAIHLKGKEAHASEPENGINPALAIAEIIQYCTLKKKDEILKNIFYNITPISIKMGEKAYGISPGQAELHFTMRTWREEEMLVLKSNFIKQVELVCKKYNIEYEFEWVEYFPAAINDNRCNNMVMESAESLGLKVIKRSDPFRFGEDFGWFARAIPASMFGLGAGIDMPPLHDASYDFPDQIIDKGSAIFQAIISNILD